MVLLADRHAARGDEHVVLGGGPSDRVRDPVGVVGQDTEVGHRAAELAQRRLSADQLAALASQPATGKTAKTTSMR